jgi:polar amino acid transport system substrate-binding protein
MPGQAEVANLLRVGVSTNAPPLIYRDGQTITGLEAELAQRFAGFLGKSVQFVELEWQDQIPALFEDRIDIIMSGMSITELRQIRIAFNKPYMRTGQTSLIRNTDKQRFGSGYYALLTQHIRVGVVKGTTGNFFVQKNFYNAKIVTFSSARNAVRGLLHANIDVVIHDAPIILMLAAINEAKGLMPITSLLPEEYLAWGIRKNDVTLLDAANSCIDALNQRGELYEIVTRWVPFLK